METVSVYRARVRGWEGAFAYARMRDNPQKPLKSSTPYRNRWEDYTMQFVGLHRTLGAGFLDDRQALIIGPGADPTETGLLFGAFPKLARLHLLDWHEPNIDRLEEILTQWAEQQPQYGRVKLHLSDAVNMEDISSSTLHLVQINNVLQHIEGLDGSLPRIVPQKVLDILRETKRVLVPEGCLFMLRTEVSPRLFPATEDSPRLFHATEDSPQFFSALESLGFKKVLNNLWRRVA